MKILLRLLLALTCLFLVIPVMGADWPHWRGPTRDGVTTEASGWKDGRWQLSGPVWKFRFGDGASSPLVAGGDLYGIGWQNGRDVVRCLDVSDGSLRWERSYPSPRYGRHALGDQGFYRGTTATPEFDPGTGLLYTLSCDGSLNAWNTREKGAPVWGLNLYDRFGMERRPQITSRKNTRRDYGFTCAPLVFGDWLLVETGDRRGGNLKAFDRRTGELRWSSENRDPAGHSGGLAPMTIDGVPCVAVATSWNVLVVRLDGKNAGKTVAEFEWKTDFSNTIAGVAVEGQDLLISSRYNQMAMARIHVDLKRGGSLVWRNRHPTGVCTPVIHRGNIYFANKGIHCVDFASGKLRWQGGSIGDAGSCYITGDERLVVWGNGGDLFLVEGAGRSPGRCRVLAERRRIFRDMAWPHVTGAGERIFCKTVSGDLACFELSDHPSKPVPPGSPEQSSKFSPGEMTSWPGPDPDLVVGWKRGGGIAGCVGHSRRMRLTPRDDAGFGPSGEMDLGGGAFQVSGSSGTLLAGLKKTNRMTLELIFESASLDQRGPARILSFSRDPYHRNVTIGQERDRLVLRLRTPSTGDNGSSPEVTLCPIRAGEIYHLVVSYEPGETIAWLNGIEVLRSGQVRGDFRNWEDGHQLILGDEWSGGDRNWAGKIFGFAIFQRPMTEEEVEARFAELRRR